MPKGKTVFLDSLKIDLFVTVFRTVQNPTKLFCFSFYFLFILSQNYFCFYIYFRYGIISSHFFSFEDSRLYVFLVLNVRYTYVQRGVGGRLAAQSRNYNKLFQQKREHSHLFVGSKLNQDPL